MGEREEGKPVKKDLVLGHLCMESVPESKSRTLHHHRHRHRNSLSLSLYSDVLCMISLPLKKDVTIHVSFSSSKVVRD